MYHCSLHPLKAHTYENQDTRQNQSNPNVKTDQNSQAALSKNSVNSATTDYAAQIPSHSVFVGNQDLFVFSYQNGNDQVVLQWNDYGDTPNLLYYDSTDNQLVTQASSLDEIMAQMPQMVLDEFKAQLEKVSTPDSPASTPPTQTTQPEPTDPVTTPDPIDSPVTTPPTQTTQPEPTSPVTTPEPVETPVTTPPVTNEPQEVDKPEATAPVSRPTEPEVKEWTPFTFQIPSDKDPSDVYVRVQGINPQTNNWSYVTFDNNGNPAYHDMQNANPADYCTKLSDLPATVNLPELTSGRMYFSVGKPLYSENPDPQNPSSQDYNTKWSTIEFTNNDTGIWANSTAVDTFGSPSLQMQMQGNQGVGPAVGYDGDPQALLTKAQNLMQEYSGNSEKFNNLFMTGADGSITRVMSPKHKPEDFKSYYNQYLQNTLLPYFKTHDLYVHATVNGQLETLRGRVSDNAQQFDFYDRSGNLVTSLPTNADNSMPWMTGAIGEWMGGQASSSTQADLARDLSALLSSGIRPQDTNTSWDNPISKSYFENMSKDKFFQAVDTNGNAMYNVYERAMHEAGFNGYAYDYDDMYGADGTQVGGHGDDPSFNVTINY